MYEWDNDRAEDAKFAMNFGFVYRHLPTTMDAAIGFLANRTFFAFPNAAPEARPTPTDRETAAVPCLRRSRRGRC